MTLYIKHASVTSNYIYRDVGMLTGTWMPLLTEVNNVCVWSSVLPLDSQALLTLNVGVNCLDGPMCAFK
jgi:hypothetical protein